MLLLVLLFTITKVLAQNNGNCHVGYYCDDKDCYPGVCYKDHCNTGYHRECKCCYECRPGSNNEVCERQGKRFCDGYKCVNCINDDHCSSDGNCNSVCENGNCVIKSNLDCSQTNQHCLISNHQCVNCTNDSHCFHDQTKPYCDIQFNKCEVCTNNVQCRTNDRCNALCNTTVSTQHQCYIPTDQDIQNPVKCNTTIELCSNYEGVCKPRCISNANCTSDFPICDIDGACKKCTHNVDCNYCPQNTYPLYYSYCIGYNQGFYYQNTCTDRGERCFSGTTINRMSIFILSFTLIINYLS